MVKVTNVFGDKYSGKVAQAGVFATWKGVQYRREYVIPSNPNTPAQQNVRNSFTDAVDKWHTFSPYQTQAYGPLTAGMRMSGFNLFISRWQKMTTAERAAYVAPYVGFIQVGSGAMSAEQSVSTVANQQEYTLGTLPLVIGETDFAEGTGDLAPVAIVDIKRGRVDFLKAVSGAVTIDYTAGGRTVTGEAVATDAQIGDIVYLDNLDIDYKSTVIKDDGSAVPSLEVDIVAHKVAVRSDSTYTQGGSIKYKNYTPVEQVKYELFKAQTQFNTARAYSDSYGIIKLGQTAEDGNRDGNISHPAYADIVYANISPADAASDKYVPLVAL